MKLLLVGTGGYAANYVKLLLEGRLPDLQWEGIVDPYYSACSLKDEIRNREYYDKTGESLEPEEETKQS